MPTALVEYRLDVIVFIVLALGAAGAAHVWLRRAHHAQGLPGLAWGLLTVFVAGGVALGEWSAARSANQLRGMLNGFAATYGLELERLGHARLTLDTPPDDSLYLALIAAQKRWLGVNPWVNDIYTFRKRPDGELVFLVDSETDYDHNGRYEGDREARTDIGESYPTDPTIEQAFAGTPTFNGVPASDRWGTWVSASVPLRDSTGRVEGVLGVDYAADNWVRTIAGARAASLGFASILIALLIGAGTMLITARLAAAQMRRAHDAALDSARLKSEFLANMSHEIRTPMNGVLGMLGLLVETPLDPDQREQAALAYQSAESLLAILNDILDFSKIESGKLQIEPVPFDLGKTVDAVVGLLGPSAQRKRVTLAASYDPSAPRRLVGDPGRIRQILTNLVGNALKFTEHGEVTVRIACVTREADRALLALSVEDTGIGIPADKLETIFDKFTQADTSTTRRFGGTGLGLAISRQLVGLMGGRLTVRSAVGQGSTFTATIPLPLAKDEAGAPPAAAASAAPAPRPGAGLRVLVADDNVVNQTVAVRMLRRLGCEVDVVSNGVEAVAIVQRQAGNKPYDLIFLDGQMPDLDGPGAAAAIRALDGPAGRTPIVAMTAYAFPADRERCLAAGMNDYIAKPVTMKDLDRVLSSIVPRPTPNP